MSGLNGVLHDLAHAVGMNRSHPIHDKIDQAVPADKDENEEGSSDA